MKIDCHRYTSQADEARAAKQRGKDYPSRAAQQKRNRASAVRVGACQCSIKALRRLPCAAAGALRRAAGNGARQREGSNIVHDAGMHKAIQRLSIAILHLRIMFGFQALKQYRQNQFMGDGTAGQLYFFNNRRQQTVCPSRPGGRKRRGRGDRLFRFNVYAAHEVSL
ncbi:hypothetical protein Sant_0321 [Sodalis praecaptivus]|uniref:Uncharacterized protein n=1 Tax=Sodalis praecaptivus TaxID=1239307 RepID=W0HSE8_9GAMM|nr:hypothetical protein Sant_0321 [Sodalis praecaptivus]